MKTLLTATFAAALIGLPISSQAVVLGDLQGYWTFDNSGNLGEDSGSNGNDLTATGTPTYNASGKFGGASEYDGDTGATSDALTSTVFPTGIPVANAAYSITAWVNADTDNPNGGLISWGNNANNQKNATRFDGNNRYNHYWWSNDLNSNDVGNQEDGNWHHVAVTYDPLAVGIDQIIYVDGAVANSRDSNNAKNTAATNFFLGRAASTGETLNGRLDDVAVFSAPLTAGDVSFLYNNGTGNTVAALVIPEPAAGILGLLGFALILRRRR